MEMDGAARTSHRQPGTGNWGGSTRRYVSLERTGSWLVDSSADVRCVCSRVALAYSPRRATEILGGGGDTGQRTAARDRHRQATDDTQQLKDHTRQTSIQRAPSPSDTEERRCRGKSKKGRTYLLWRSATRAALHVLHGRLNGHIRPRGWLLAAPTSQNRGTVGMSAAS